MIKKLVINIDENIQPISRTGILTVTDGTLSARCSITQAAKELRIVPASASVNSDGGTVTASIIYGGTSPLTATSSTAWATAHIVSESTLEVAYEPNMALSSRNATITVGDGEMTATFELEQAMAYAEIRLSPTTSTVGSSAGTATATITTIGAVGALSVQVSDSSIVTSATIEGSELVMHFAKNTLPSQRTCLVTVTDGNVSAEYMLVQTAPPQPVYYRVTGTTTNCTVEGYGIYEENTHVVLRVTPDDGYEFTQWEDGDAHNPRTIVVTGNTTLNVECEVMHYTVTGTPTNCTVEGYGTYEYGSICTLFVTPDEGYEFTQWEDGDTHNPKTFTVTANTTLNAECEPIPSVKAYVSFTTNVDGRFKFDKVNIPHMQYAFDRRGTWQDWDLNYVSVSSGQTIYFRSINNNFGFEFGRFSFDTQRSNARLILDGNIMALQDYTNMNSTVINMTCYRTFMDMPIVSVNADFLPATTLAVPQCYRQMFRGCDYLTNAPALPATTLSRYCYGEMFSGCTSLTTAPALSATTLANDCYYNMFAFCPLTTAPALPATTLTSECYYKMFLGCSMMTKAPELPATIMAYYCYSHMFDGCTSLTGAPELPSTALTTGCYSNMFHGCTSLTAAPFLPAVVMPDYCYEYMFSGCTNLNYVKSYADKSSASSPYTYSVEWLADVSPTGTFVKRKGVSWLIGESGIPRDWIVEEDPYIYTVTGTAEFCTVEGYGTYADGATCTLTVTPDEDYRFRGWSDGDTSNPRTLTVTRNTTLNVTCQPAAYYAVTGTPTNCTVEGYGTYIEDSICTLFVTPDEGYEFTQWEDGETHNPRRIAVTGNVTINVECTEIPVYYTVTGTPTNCTVEGYGTYAYGTTCTLTVTPDEGYEFIEWPDGDTHNPRTIAVTGDTTLNVECQPMPPAVKKYICFTTDTNCRIGFEQRFPSSTQLEYSYDNTNWTRWNFNNLSLNTGQSLYFRGKNTTGTLLDSFTCDNSNANLTLDGNLQALIDYETPPSETGVMNLLFMNMPILSVNADFLPATELTEECYYALFLGCSKLTAAPELPAATLVYGCYNSMFDSCESLNYIKCLATDITAEDCTAGWVSGVSSTGTFVKAQGVDWPTGNSGIPTGWSIEEV